MTYVFKKMSLEKVPDALVPVVAKAIEEYLKKLNNTDTLKGIPYGMDAYNHGEGHQLQITCHIGGKGKKNKYSVYITKCGIYGFHVKGSVSDVDMDSYIDDPHPAFVHTQIEYIGRGKPNTDSRGYGFVHKPVAPDFTYPINDPVLQTGITDLALQSVMTDKMREIVGKNRRYCSTTGYIGIETAKEINAQI